MNRPQTDLLHASEIRPIEHVCDATSVDRIQSHVALRAHRPRTAAGASDHGCRQKDLELLDPDATLAAGRPDDYVVQLGRRVRVDRDVRAKLLRAHKRRGVRADLRNRLLVDGELGSRAGVVARPEDAHDERRVDRGT